METGGWALRRSTVRNEGCARLLPSFSCQDDVCGPQGVLVSHCHRGTRACGQPITCRLLCGPVFRSPWWGESELLVATPVCSVSSSSPLRSLQGLGWAEWVRGSVPRTVGTLARLESQV